MGQEGDGRAEAERLESARLLTSQFGPGCVKSR